MLKKYVLRISIVLVLAFLSSACGFVTGQLKDKANEKALLKPGALDVPITKQYETYSYKMLGKYRVSHDWVASVNPCHYKAIYSKTPTERAAKVIRDGDIYEANGHTYQEFYQPGYPERSKDLKFLNIDRYTRPEWTVSGYQGKPVTNKGFAPICFQTWQSTQHFLTIFLNKRILKVPNISGAEDGVITYQQVGANNWWVQKFDYLPYKANGFGRVVESWMLPIADTGYVFIFELGANQDSLKYPEAHAQMQQIFEHLIESVEIVPLAE